MVLLEFPSKESLLLGCANIEFTISNNDTNVKTKWSFLNFVFPNFYSLFCVCDMEVS